MIDAGEPTRALPAATLRMRLTETGEVRVYRVPLVGKHLDDFIRATAARAPGTRIELIVPAQLAHAKIAGLMKQLAAAGLREIAVTAP